MGGKNPTIVTANADLDKAVDGVARSAFGFSGQKCSACSRVYVESPVYDAFIDKLVARTTSLKVGDPAERDTYVGPVIDEGRTGAVRCGRRIGQGWNGARRRTPPDRRGLRQGTFVEPTIVDGLPLDHSLFRNELFLPFLVVGAVDSLDEAIRDSNDTEYGLTAGIFSEDETEIQHFFDTIEAGVIYANRRGGATTGAWPGCQSFCGWKGSGSTGKGGLARIRRSSSCASKAGPSSSSNRNGLGQGSFMALDVEYMTRVTCDLCRIPSPTGYTHLAVAKVQELVGELGLDVAVTNKGSLVVGLPGSDEGSRPHALGPRRYARRDGQGDQRQWPAAIDAHRRI